MSAKSHDDVLATLRFLHPPSLPDEEELILDRRSVGQGEPAKQNHDIIGIENILIRDIRTMKSPPSLKKEGFTVINSPSTMRYEDYDDEEKLKSIYAPELRKELETLLGASEIYFHECVIRKSNKTPGYGVPLYVTHIDYTLRELERVITLLAEDNAPNLLKRHYQSLNVWRPLRGPVRDAPLALCDASTTDPSNDFRMYKDLQAEGSVESYCIKYSSRQKWYYLSDQDPSEALVFNVADSCGKTGVPHASFRHPEYPDEKESRESIEIRALVFY